MKTYIIANTPGEIRRGVVCFLEMEVLGIINMRTANTRETRERDITANVLNRIAQQLQRDVRIISLEAFEAQKGMEGAYITPGPPTPGEDD